MEDILIQYYSESATLSINESDIFIYLFTLNLSSLPDWSSLSQFALRRLKLFFELYFSLLRIWVHDGFCNLVPLAIFLLRYAGNNNCSKYIILSIISRIELRHYDPKLISCILVYLAHADWACAFFADPLRKATRMEVVHTVYLCYLLAFLHRGQTNWAQIIRGRREMPGQRGASIACMFSRKQVQIWVPQHKIQRVVQ